MKSNQQGYTWTQTHFPMNVATLLQLKMASMLAWEAIIGTTKKFCERAKVFGFPKPSLRFSFPKPSLRTLGGGMCSK